MSSPTGDLSDHIDAVFTRESTEMGDDSCSYDLWKDKMVKLCAHTTPSFSQWKSAVSKITVDKTPPAGDIGWTILPYKWREESEEKKQKTYHYELYGDWHRQLLSVAAVKFFDHNEHKEGQNADDKLWHLGLRQQVANIQYGLWEKGRWREVGVSKCNWVWWLIKMTQYKTVSTFIQSTDFRMELIFKQHLYQPRLS